MSIPALRFPEFSGEWHERHFSGVFESRPTREFQVLSSEILPAGAYPVVDQGPDLISGYVEEPTKLFKELPAIIFGDHTTNLKYIDFPFVVGADGTKLLAVPNDHARFAFFCLVKNNVEQEGYKRHFSILKNVKVWLPTSPEQQKVADFFDAVEARVGLLRRRREALTAYKKAMMQRLFTRALRFTKPNGSPFTDWGLAKVSDARDKSDRYSFTGGPFGSDLKQEHYRDAGVMVVQLQNIGSGTFIWTQGADTYVSAIDADRLKSSNLFPGDIIISKMGDPVARSAFVPKNHPRYVMCSDGIRFSVDNMRWTARFVFYAINTNSFLKAAYRLSIGSTRKRISLDDLRSIVIPKPHPEEQQKIADFLTALDTKIDAVAAQIAAMQRFKQGLLQQMFV